jgi:5'-3' exonuclease
MKKQRCLIIDMFNMFYRGWIVDPSLSVNGDPIGGLKGSLKILQKLLRETQPNRVFICWDGPGGSQRRRSINKAYKEGRKPAKVNWDSTFLSPAAKEENRKWQQVRLMEYFNNMPLCQLLLPSVEADDIISFVKDASCLKGWQKIIVSSDKDFFQLVDSETILYRPIQKQLLNEKDILENHKIHPQNMALARAIVGDKSDNLPGIAGIGLTTVANRFPFLSDEESHTIDEVLKHCQNANSAAKAYTNIIEGEDIIRQNYKMMQLYAPSISVQGKTYLRETIKNCEITFNKTEIKKMMIQDGFGEFNWIDLYQIFNRISVEK